MALAHWPYTVQPHTRFQPSLISKHRWHLMERDIVCRLCVQNTLYMFIKIQNITRGALINQPDIDFNDYKAVVFSSADLSSLIAAAETFCPNPIHFLDRWEFSSLNTADVVFHSAIHPLKQIPQSGFQCIVSLCCDGRNAVSEAFQPGQE